jgi:hypothetical protein
MLNFGLNVMIIPRKTWKCYGWGMASGWPIFAFSTVSASCTYSGFPGVCPDLHYPLKVQLHLQRILEVLSRLAISTVSTACTYSRTPDFGVMSGGWGL